MACIIYREGKGTTEHGIECESTTCEVEHLEGLLEAGWSVNPPGYESEDLVFAEEEGALEEEEDESSGDGDSTNLNPVRISAKEAGIEGWENKRIATLQAALDSLNDEQGK